MGNRETIQGLIASAVLEILFNVTDFVGTSCSQSCSLCTVFHTFFKLFHIAHQISSYIEICGCIIWNDVWSKSAVCYYSVNSRIILALLSHGINQVKKVNHRIQCIYPGIRCRCRMRRLSKEFISSSYNGHVIC